MRRRMEKRLFAALVVKRKEPDLVSVADGGCEVVRFAVYFRRDFAAS